MTTEATFRVRRQQVEEVVLVLFLYVATRALIRLAFAFGFSHILYIPAYAHSSDPWLRWDSLWYLRIAETGYHWNSDLPYHYQTAAFFPFYPLTIRAAHVLLGLGYRTAAVLSANLAGLVFSYAFYQYVRLRTDQPTARVALLLVLLFPTSLYLSAGYAAAWLWAAAAVALYAVSARRYALAVAASFVASAAEPTGAALVVLVLAALWWDRRRVTVWWLPAAAVSLGGLLGYALYLGLRFHDPLAFMYAQAAWLPPVSTMRKLMRLFSLSFLFRDASPWSLDFPIVLLFVVAALWGTLQRILTAPEALYVWAVLLGSIWVHALPADALTSMARTLTLALPLFLVVAVEVQCRRLLLAFAAATFATGLMVFAALFGQGWWVQ